MNSFKIASLIFFLSLAWQMAAQVPTPAHEQSRPIYLVGGTLETVK